MEIEVGKNITISILNVLKLSGLCNNQEQQQSPEAEKVSSCIEFLVGERGKEDYM